MLVAIQSSLPHEDMSVATAMMQVGGSIAASIGSTMAGTIWNNMLPGQIAKYVPGEYDYAKIVGDVLYASALPEPQWEGVVAAYGHVQMVLSIISICIAVLTFCFTIPMKTFGLENYNENEEQAAHDGPAPGLVADSEKTQVYGIERADTATTERVSSPDNHKEYL